MSKPNEIIIRIKNGNVAIENCVNGITSYKPISPDSLLDCLNKSLMRGGVVSGLLPKNCLSLNTLDNGSRYVTLLHSGDKANISYVGTEYKDFPLPRLIFGFCISEEGRISQCHLGVVGNDNTLKPTTPMFAYPFSNVSGTRLCIGNNSLPKVESLHTLGSLTHHILSMGNNNDHFNPAKNKLKLEMRDLLELLKDKPPSYYYDHILVPSGKMLGDFIVEGGVI